MQQSGGLLAAEDGLENQSTSQGNMLHVAIGQRKSSDT